jgi:2-phosphosulfolactate phosphatase
MPVTRQLHVHLLPEMASAEELRGGLVLVIDVLRASTTIVHALAAGAKAVYPVAEPDEARVLAEQFRGERVLRGGERGSRPIPGFDLGNSPSEYTPALCEGSRIIFTTTNGTRALLHAASAERVLVAAFTNFSAVCGVALADARPVHILCAGTGGQVTLEDTLLAGAFVEALTEKEFDLNDGARLAWDCFEFHGRLVPEAIRMGRSGQHLIELGYEADLKDAAQVDRHPLVPELRRDPLRVEVGNYGMVRSRWPR